MTQITAEHLQHMAKRHHATMKKLDGIKEKISLYTQKSFGLLETGFGSWTGGLLEGRTGGASLGPVPLNLGIGVVLATVGAIAGARKEKVTVTEEVTADFRRVTAQRDQIGEHLTNLGNGFIGSYLAATGYAFGKRWKETGKVLGGGGHPWTQPYENGWPKGGQSTRPTTMPPAMPMPNFDRSPSPSQTPAPPTAGWYE